MSDHPGTEAETGGEEEDVAASPPIEANMQDVVPQTPPLPLTPEEDVAAKLTHLEELVRSARTMPLSSSALISREDFLAILADIKESLPKELHQARWMLREKDEFISKARREAEMIIDDAHAEAARMVSETEVVRDAEWKAGLIIDEAEARGRSLRAETDSYIDAKLASFESILRRTLEAIVAGRERLRAVPDLEPSPPVGRSARPELRAVSESGPEVSPEHGSGPDSVFDQDLG